MQTATHSTYTRAVVHAAARVVSTQHNTQRTHNTMSKQSEAERLNRAIIDQESTISILKRDAQDSTRVDNLIADKHRTIERLQREIAELCKSRERLPDAIRNAERKLQLLKQQRKALETSGDVAKLVALIEKARAAGIDVSSLLGKS